MKGSTGPVSGGFGIGGGNDGKAKVLQAVNLVELIGKTVALKRRGKNFIGLCPFHSEKTPSFNVDPVKQYYKCFGCKESGNAIDFVIKRDRLSFIDALRQLADEYNIELPRLGGGSKQNSSDRQLLFEAHSAACSLFEKLLAHPQQGVAARNYLKERGFNNESITRFQIGLSLDAWDTLAKHPLMKKFPASLLQQAGLVKARNTSDGHYDTFRNRLMFPIRDEQARVIAFGGRIVPGSEDPAKYLNSPETPLFSKSRSIFGIDLARQRIVESRTVAVVEGYTDVVMAHQYGATNVVSILGTALTEPHLAILRRFADRIVLLFDPDTAGETAVARAVELFLTQPIEILIAGLPEDLDPDEFLLKHGLDSFNAVLANAQDALAYQWRKLTREVAENDLTGRQKAVKQYLDLIANARGAGPIDPLRWHQSLMRVSRLTETPVEELNKMFRVRGGSNRRGDASRSAAPQAARTQDESESSESTVVFARPLDADSRARRWIMGVLLAEPRRWHDVQQHLHVEDFDPGDVPLHSIVAHYWAHQCDEGEPVLNEFLSQLDEQAKSLAIELVEEIEAMSDLDKTLSEAMAHLETQRRRSEEKKTIASLRRTTETSGESNEPRRNTDEQDEIALLRKLQEQVRRPDVGRV
ncbi:hypothetical protein BH09PLA1_BH09PLA1_35620 [soil metagenome]